MRRRINADPQSIERGGERRRNFYRGIPCYARFQRNAKSWLCGFDRVGGKRSDHGSCFEKHRRARPAVRGRSISLLYILGGRRQPACGRIFFPVGAYRGGNGFCDGNVFLFQKRYFVALFLCPRCNGLFAGIFSSALYYRRRGSVCCRLFMRTARRIYYSKTFVETAFFQAVYGARSMKNPL